MIFIIIITRNILNVYMKNRRLMILLQEKTQELEAAIKKMREYSDELRETAELRARENLVNELHDNLGHILATASIGAQATGVLMEKSIPEAKRQLEIVTGQIRTAMKTLRSVITGSGGACAEENLPFDKSLRCLVSETEKHTGAAITCRLPENLDSLSKPVRKFIYYALMEGLTNALRHGGATGFDFELKKTDKQICFRLQDNGTGFENITYGFGLTKIKNDAEHIGAQMKITGTEGCLIEFSIPYEEHMKAKATGNEEN